jgi:hypothetical protein
MITAVDGHKLERQGCGRYACLRRITSESCRRLAARASRGACGSETILAPSAGSCRLDFAIAGRRVRDEGIEQLMGGVSHLIHRPVEG